MSFIETIEDVALLAESEDVECKLAGGRDGRGQLPSDFWPTYSAFANSAGGTVILGLREQNRKFELIGIKDIQKVKTDLFNQLNNKQKVSVNLLSNQQVSTVSIEGKDVLLITIPAAGRKRRPVYINGNVMGGTYFRSDEGDRPCDPETVKRMLAEQIENTRDNRVLVGFSPEDLNRDTNFGLSPGHA